ncbi:MAG: metallophosphoesterase [Desulfobacterales bacterium]|nr:metallophosphoesterase [Desulfobacterales bacterium]
MKRTRTWIGGTPLAKPLSIPTAILTADWHVRWTVPVCRTDDFMAAMRGKIDFVFDLALEHRIPILLAGDIGLKAQWPSWLEEEFIRKVKESPNRPEIYAIPGQHDLPDHNLELWRKSSIGVLHIAGAITFFGVDDDHWPNKYQSLNRPCLESIFCFPYGIEISHLDRKSHVTADPVIAMMHTLITERAPESFLAEHGACSAMSLLQKFPEYDLILTGDNHKPFVVECEGRLLVNPGSLMRTAADQVDHKPRVYLWYAQENRVEPVYLPIEEDVIDRTHIDLQEAKDERIEAYVSRLSEEVEIGLSFEGNLESYFRTNRVRKPVQDKVWAAMPK